jgi:hypothetical protein
MSSNTTTTAASARTSAAHIALLLRETRNRVRMYRKAIIPGTTQGTATPAIIETLAATGLQPATEYAFDIAHSGDRAAVEVLITFRTSPAERMILSQIAAEDLPASVVSPPMTRSTSTKKRKGPADKSVEYTRQASESDAHKSNRDGYIWNK